jgi:hypothetical protein
MTERYGPSDGPHGVSFPSSFARATQKGQRGAAREQWLHWIEERESLEPLADGEWSPQFETPLGKTERGRSPQCLTTEDTERVVRAGAAR